LPRFLPSAKFAHIREIIWEIERPNDGSNRHKFDEKYVLDFLPTSLKINSEIRHVRWRKVATREERSPGVADAHIARSIARSRSLETPQRARAGTASLAKARGKFQPNLLIP
jgi:hypothetical protein